MKLHQVGDTSIYEEFEQSYIRLRKQELRLYSDEELVLLPDIKTSNPHYIEWQIRKQSANRLVRYLKQQKRPLRIIEVGCGNGWLANKISAVPNSLVLGIDINQQELSQAERVFGKNQNLRFLSNDIHELKLYGFDIIVFAASLQYFSPLHPIIDAALARLNQQGEIHIIDTMIYNTEDLAPAKERSAIYFTNMDCLEMTKHYHHHSYKELNLYPYDIIYKPGILQKILPGVYNPFPWIRIKKN